MAISANGIIASKSGSEDFLSHTNWLQFLALLNKVGCFVWGRKTYDAVQSWGGNYLQDLKPFKKVIISQSDLDLKEDFMLAHSPEEALSLLADNGFKEALITGGSTINSEFAKKGLIDEVIFDVNPAILGEGISVFKPSEFELPLQLVDVKKVEDDIVELRYKVKK
jgi:dihydrofolate reductase